MKKTGHYVLLIVGVGVAVFIGWEMFQAWQAGKRAIADLISAPWRSLKAAWSTATGAATAAASTVASGVTAAASLPGLTQTQLQNAQAQGSVAASYQPGGTLYNMILATQGQPAA